MEASDEAGKIYQGPAVRKWGPRSDYVAHVFVDFGSIIIRRLYKLTLSDQAQVPLQLRVSFSNIV
jgi:hypothetical protein